jgi:hypothetical protein
MAKGFPRTIVGLQGPMLEPVRVRAADGYVDPRVTGRSRGSRANRVVKHPQGK